MNDTLRECRRCHNTYPLTLDYFYKNGANNFQYYCKQCQAVLKKEWATKNREKARQYAAEQRDKHPEWRERNRSYCKAYYEKNKETINKSLREKRILNYEDVIAKQREYRKNNRERINAQKRDYEQKKKECDPQYRLKLRLRNTIRKSFSRRGKCKSSLLKEITGLYADELCNYLIQTFYVSYGRAWDGEEPVHIDHIVPISQASTEAEIIKLCHYSNLRLITAEDNMKKSNKTDYVIGG